MNYPLFPRQYSDLQKHAGFLDWFAKKMVDQYGEKPDDPDVQDALKIADDLRRLHQSLKEQHRENRSQKANHS
jgi:hypothetical protein